MREVKMCEDVRPLINITIQLTGVTQTKLEEGFCLIANTKDQKVDAYLQNMRRDFI